MVNQSGIKDIIEEKQLAITEKDIQHRLAIETKDNALALLNDDLDESKENMQYWSIDMNNWKLALFHTLKILKKINSMVVIQKNNGDEYPYIAICGQQGYVAQKIRNKFDRFPEWSNCSSG